MARRVILALLILSIGTLIVRSLSTNRAVTSHGDQANIKEATPTPFPFQDMTIPYLRNRTYSSSITQQEPYRTYPDYTSYLVSYESDGLTIHGLLTIPTGTKPEGGFPGIVFVHGYIPPTLYRTTERYNDHVDYLARSGFVVFKIDLRGHGMSEGTPDGAYYSSSYVIDTLNAYAALSNFKVVNAHRVGMWGHSMAGNVLMRAFAAEPDIPGVVIWAGAGYTYDDLLQYRIQDLSYRPPTPTSGQHQVQQRVRDLYGTFSSTSPFWRRVAVTDYLHDIRGALEIHHAVDDSVVSIEYSRNLMKLLDKTHMVHTLYEYEQGGHNIEGTSFSRAMERTVQFFRNTL